jgi:hypothetical protein
VLSVLGNFPAALAHFRTAARLDAQNTQAQTNYAREVARTILKALVPAVVRCSFFVLCSLFFVL